MTPLLEKELLEELSAKIYKKFPDFEKIKPKVKLRPKDEETGKSPPGYLLIYRKKAAGPDGQPIERIVRVILSESGKIKKISTSK